MPRWFVGGVPSGAVQAGMRYALVYEWVFVHWLWVGEGCCRVGVGSQLIGQAEEAGRRNAGPGIDPGMFTFQAPGFYQRHGYKEFGRIECFPPWPVRASGC